VERLKLVFLRHEIWALQMARRIPFLSLFFASTLWVWALPLVFVLLPLATAMTWASATQWLFVFHAINMIIGIIGLAIIAPWFFRWYFLCTGLMFGKTGMADAKAVDLANQLNEATR
jgi:hypothetical protein